MVALMPCPTLTSTGRPDLSQHLAVWQAALFNTEDTVCLERAKLVTEANLRFWHEASPISRAKSFAHILTHMTLDLSSNPVFAGNTSSRPRGWMLIPEFGMKVCPQGLIELDWLSQAWLDEKIPASLHDYWADRAFGGTGGIGHMSLDFSRVVDLGIQGIRAEIDDRLDDAMLTEDGRLYLEAMIISCDAVVHLAHRYADEAERLAVCEADSVIKACLERVAGACRHVPEHPARTLFEGLQAMVLVHLCTMLEGQGLSMSIGLPDRVLARFSDEAAADMEGATQLVSAFLLKVCANAFQGRMSKTQAVTIGGADAGDRDCCNGITTAFLNAYERTPVADPHLFFRWHDAVDPVCRDQVIRLLSNGRSMPLLVHDAQAVPGFLERGVAPEDAWNFCMIGCNEIGIPGKCWTSAMTVGYASNEAMRFHDLLTEQADDLESMADILSAWTAIMYQYGIKGHEQRTKALAKHASERPFPFTSLFCHGPLVHGSDYLTSMPYHHIETCFAQGTANVINALVVIDELVFRKQTMSLRELLNRTEAGDSSLTGLIAEAPAWGNDDDRVDQLALAWHMARDRGLQMAADALGIDKVMTCHVIRSLHHLMGAGTPATVDGRSAGEELGDSIGPICGTTSEGPTAILRSVAKLDSVRFYPGIYNFNFSLAGNQAKPPLLWALIEGFFAMGGQEIQVAVLNAEKLKAAKENPDAFQDLVVRIAGLNARFVELSAKEQDEIIRRAESF